MVMTSIAMVIIIVRSTMVIIMSTLMTACVGVHTMITLILITKWNMIVIHTKTQKNFRESAYIAYI